MEALLVALKSRGIELSEPVFQDDQAYAPAGWQFGDSKLGVSFLRLRTVAGPPLLHPQAARGQRPGLPGVRDAGH